MGEHDGERHYNRMGRGFILGCLAVSIFLGWKVFRPFTTAIASAAILDVVFYPVFARLARALGGRRTLAAGLTVLLVVICVIAPLSAVGVVFTKEALQLYTKVSVMAQDGSLDDLLRYRNYDHVEQWVKVHAPWLPVQSLDLKNTFVAMLSKIGARAGEYATAAATNLLAAVGTFAVVLFSLFFFLLDGGAFGRWLTGLVPLNRRHQEQLVRTFVGITKTAVTGSGLVAVAQGVLGGLAFWAVGLQGVLWGFVMCFTSIVPVVGTALVWVPAGILLLVQGHVGPGLFILAYGAVVISGVDNLIRMFIVKGPVAMSPLLIFFSVLGGIKVAGLLGVVFGPLITALVMTLLEIYRWEFMTPQDPAAQEPEP
jgi:predicted PurR-regulated permease PerM